MSPNPLVNLAPASHFILNVENSRVSKDAIHGHLWIHFKGLWWGFVPDQHSCNPLVEPIGVTQRSGTRIWHCNPCGSPHTSAKTPPPPSSCPFQLSQSAIYVLRHVFAKQKKRNWHIWDLKALLATPCNLYAVRSTDKQYCNPRSVPKANKVLVWQQNKT